MPTYEYLCADCGKTFETVQKITEDALTKCLLCGGNHLKRLISPTAFHLKGGGWYKTDYGSSGSSTDSAKSDSKTETKTETTTESKTETKAESKPDVKAEPKETKPEKKPSSGE